MAEDEKIEAGSIDNMIEGGDITSLRKMAAFVMGRFLKWAAKVGVQDLQKEFRADKKRLIVVYLEDAKMLMGFRVNEGKLEWYPDKIVKIVKMKSKESPIEAATQFRWVWCLVRGWANRQGEKVPYDWFDMWRLSHIRIIGEATTNEIKKVQEIITLLRDDLRKEFGVK